MEDWYSISGKDFVEHDGAALCSLYRSSPPAVVMGVFTNHAWIPWKFRTVPNSSWEDDGAIRKFAEYPNQEEGVEFQNRRDLLTVKIYPPLTSSLL